MPRGAPTRRPCSRSVITDLLARSRRSRRTPGPSRSTGLRRAVRVRLPFAGLHQLLRPVAERADTLSAPQRDALRSTFGFESAVGPDLFLIGLAVLNLLAETAEETPILLALDDCQWLDRSTCEVLAFVARRIAADPIHFVVTTRDRYESPLDTAGLRRVRIDALDDHDAAALLDRHAPSLPHGLRSRF